MGHLSGSLGVGASRSSTGAEMQISEMEQVHLQSWLLAFQLDESLMDREVVVAFSTGHADDLL